jgi:catechol 2,3-dioxygenase-like lactoylglutathione lyase family enzyme
VASTNEFKCLTKAGAAAPSWSREAMPVRRLDHILLAMPAGREADARKFYQELLGIPEAAKPAELAARGGCWFEAGELKVHLGVEKNFAPARKAHPAFIVDDLKGLTAILANAGYAIAYDLPLEGYDRIFVDDPFGNRIELMEVKPS